MFFFFFFSSRRRHTRYWRDWSSDVCSSDLVEAQRRCARTVAMPPQGRDRVEDVFGQQPVTVRRDELDGLDDVAEGVLSDEVVEVHPGPARLDPLQAVFDLALELV